MRLRTTLTALLLALFLAVPSPASAKGPTQVEVRNLSTGTTTMFTWDQPELSALMELVEFPASARKPDAVARGALTHVATLDWQFEDGHQVWLDRVFSDGAGRAWVARRDYLSGNGSLTWGRVRAAYTLDLLVAQIKPAEPEPARQEVPDAADTPRASSASPATAFGLGAAAAAVVVGGFSLVLRRRRSRLA